MEDMSRGLFRHEPAAVLTGADGGKARARGRVAYRRGQGGLPCRGQRHEAGLLEDPLPVFTGWAEQAAAGDLLEQGGRAYTVLGVEELCVGGTKVCCRLLLERRADGNDGL